MKEDTSTAVVIDVYGNTDNVETFTPLVRKIIDNSTEVTHRYYTYYLTDKDAGDVPECLPGKGNVTTTSVIGNSRLESFYASKRMFDNQEATAVFILCCGTYEDYWKTVCDVLLTPVHSWSVVAAPCNVTDNADATKVMDDVKDMLTKLPSVGELTVLRTSLIPSDLFNHGYTTRKGGITTIPTLSSLNLLFTEKKRDSRPTVSENCRRLAVTAGFDASSFHITRTNHGNNVWVFGTEKPVNFDAIVTNKPGVTVSAAGADCTPVIFADPVKKVCGAAHAGYRGTLLRVVVKTIEALQREYGSQVEDLLVTLGPSVCPNCFTFEMDDPAVSSFTEIDPSTIGFKMKGQRKRATCDIVTANRILLERAGLDPAHIDTSRATCTACDRDKFFSYERDGFPFGNQIGFISIIP